MVLLMTKYSVTWDEITTYTVEVEAEDADAAWSAFADPACWLTEPEVVTSDYHDNFEIEEI